MADSSTSSGALQESMEKPEFPSGLLGDSMQLQGTAAPFTDLASDDESPWASSGPSRSTRESSTNEPSGSPNHPQAGRLSAILQRLGPVRSDSPERKTPQLQRSRSMASSDVSQSDESPGKSFGRGVKDVFNYGRKRLLSQDGSNVETPKAGNGNSRIPVSGGRKGGRPSLDVTPSANDRTSRPVPSANEAQNGEESGTSFSPRVKQLDLQSSPTSDVQDAQDAGRRYSSKTDNLNESVVDLSSPILPLSQGEDSDAFTDGVPGVRASFLRSGSTRPLAQVDRDFAEISFPSAEVESSTPIKRKGEKQLELERGWIGSGSRSTSPEPASGFGRRSASPTREQSWGQGRQLERTNSVASDSSRPGTPNSELRSILLNPRTRGDSTHSAVSVDRRSPSPETRRARTMSTPTSGDHLGERERGWNRHPSRPETPPLPRASNRPISTHSLDAAVLNLRTSPSGSPQLGRSQSARNSRGSPAFASSSHRGVSIDDVSETASDNESQRRPASPARSQSWIMKYIVPKPSLGPAFTTTPKNSPPRQHATVAIQSTTPNESPPRRNGPPQEVVTPSKRPFHQYPVEPPSPSPPRGGLPPLPALSDDERDSPQRGSGAGLSRYGSSRSSISQTPRAPGGWVSTPARPASYPPFDDREHPKDTMTPKSDMSDSETVSILRPSSPSRQDPRTPAPPGRWANTPQSTLSQRASMRKVRFDRASPNQVRSNSLPTTPDAVVDDAHKILRDLSGLEEDGRIGTVGRKTARMVDEYGRELLFAHDGTPITRRDERSRTTSMESGMSFAPMFPGAMPADTSKRRSTTARIRMVDEMGDDITAGNPGLVNLASPVDGLGGVPELGSLTLSSNPNKARRSNGSMAHSEYSDDDTGLPHQERTQRIRKALDRIKADVGNKSEDSTTHDSYGRSSRLQDVLSRSEQARLERERLQQEMSKIPLRDMSQGNPVQSVKRSSTPQPGRSNWMVNMLLVTMGIATFGVLIDMAGRWYSYHLFLTTYHDPYFAGFHNFGDPHAPTASQWLMLGNHHPSPVKMFTEWTMEHIRKIPGLGGISYYAPIRPSFVPT